MSVYVSLLGVGCWLCFVVLWGFLVIYEVNVRVKRDRVESVFDGMEREC